MQAPQCLSKGDKERNLAVMSKKKSKISVFALVMMICVTVAGGGFGIGTVVAILLVIGFIYLLVRPYKESTTLNVGVKATK